ncbi:MAG: virulence RhuM family protein [Deltaproteobacteria bacterium]|nr:virulence RhuM family protein [Deltaproteobacteria bacterium]MBI4373768.1 virulence RhuM family protein [Deltaproteobacteria bacterium]
MKKKKSDNDQTSQILLYQTEDGQTRLEVQLQKDTVWLTQGQMADLFQITKQNVSLHIQNILAEGELQREATVKEYLTVQSEGSRQVKRQVEYYNLDLIIAVGYRVRSPRGTQFRIWATQMTAGRRNFSTLSGC